MKATERKIYAAFPSQRVPEKSAAMGTTFLWDAVGSGV
jgi:hypothetical protein